MAESYTPPGMSVSYTVPELSDPADAPQAFRDFADSISGIQDTVSVTAVSANKTLAAGDEGTMLLCDTTSADIEVTVPDNASVPLPVGFVVAVANQGGATNVVKLKKGTGVTIQDQGFLQVEDYRITTLVKVSTNFWLVQAGSATYTPPAGPGTAVFDEGASTGATFSTITDPDNGKTYRLASISSSATLAFSEVGYAEICLVGGGGSGGSGSRDASAGGGGGGGVLINPSVYVDTSATVRVGNGGSGVSNNRGNNGQSTTFFSAGAVHVAFGGGGGGNSTSTSGNTGYSGNGGDVGGGGGGATTGGSPYSGINQGFAGYGPNGPGGGAGQAATSAKGGDGVDIHAFLGVASVTTGPSTTYRGGGGGAYNSRPGGLGGESTGQNYDQGNAGGSGPGKAPDPDTGGGGYGGFYGGASGARGCAYVRVEI